MEIKFYVNSKELLKGKVPKFAGEYLIYKKRVSEEKKNELEWWVRVVYTILGELSLHYLTFVALMMALSQRTVGQITKGPRKNVI